MRKLTVRTALFASVFLFLCSTSVARNEQNEYNIKSLFILNFIKYIEWPDNNSSVVRIGVVGKSPMGDALRNMTQNRNESKKILIEEVNPDSPDGYKIILINKSENGRLDELMKKFRKKGVLIITDECKDKNAGVINLISIDNKIRFEIDPEKAKEAGVKISSKLIELATTVKS